MSGSSNTVTKTFNTAGQKSVTVRVTDDDGATATASKTFTIMANQKPTININISGEQKVGKEITVDISVSDDGRVVSLKVEGAITADKAGSYKKTFTTFGEKTITVTATDDEGAKTTVTKKFIIADLSNAEKVANFEAGKELTEIITGVKGMELGYMLVDFINDKTTYTPSPNGKSQVHFNNGKMEFIDAPVDYYDEAGKIGSPIAPSELVAHWDYINVKYKTNEHGHYFEHNETFLIYNSTGLYDFNLWNFEEEAWHRYNTMAEFVFRAYKGRKYFKMQTVYSEDWDGTRFFIDYKAWGAIIYMTGSNGYYTDTGLPDHKIQKTFLDTYVVKENNHLGLEKGTVLHNCVYSENKEKAAGYVDGVGMARITKTVVCENYGLVELESHYIDKSEF